MIKNTNNMATDSGGGRGRLVVKPASDDGLWSRSPKPKSGTMKQGSLSAAKGGTMKAYTNKATGASNKNNAQAVKAPKVKGPTNMAVKKVGGN